MRGRRTSGPTIPKKNEEKCQWSLFSPKGVSSGEWVGGRPKEEMEKEKKKEAQFIIHYAL